VSDSAVRLTPPVAPSSRRRGAYLVIGTALVALMAASYWMISRRTPQSEEALMTEGLAALYTRQDPVGAATRFRKVLELNPDHYGATFQLAMALDRSGQPVDAGAWWEKALRMAERYNDKATIDLIRARLPRPDLPADSSRQDTLMKAGLEALYGSNDPASAATRFREVLGLNPSHYGATYQLAVALDRGGREAEARPLWAKALQMAESYGDKATIDIARARLARAP
jgi:Flp pilus assembly protein TadD